MSIPQTALNREATSFPVKPSLATQVSEDTIQSHSAASTGGGRIFEAAQPVPVAGQACATVFVGVYAALDTEVGEARANCLERAVKSGSLLAVLPETDTKPVLQMSYILNLKESAKSTP